MEEKITAYIVGRIKLGDQLKEESPDEIAARLLKTYKEIEEVDIITGEWDLMIKIVVPSLEAYYHAAWSIAKNLERGWGTLVAKKIKR